MDIENYRITYDVELKGYTVMLVTGEKINGKPVYKALSQHSTIDEAVKDVVDRIVVDTIENPLNNEMEKVRQAKENLEIIVKELGIDEKSMP